MIHSVAILAAFVILCWCLYERRLTWQISADRAITLAIGLFTLGMFLCMPLQSRFIGRALTAFTGVHHLRDWIGHTMVMAALVSIVYGVAKRLAPNGQLEPFMRRVNYPTTLASQAMLVFLLLSPAGHRNTRPDFYDIPCDACLTCYWLAYCGNTAYLLCTLIKLLFIIARDPRSKLAARIYIAGCAFGLVAGEDRLVSLWTGFDDDGNFAWILTSVGMGLIGAGALRSWRMRARTWSRPDVPVLLPE